MDERKQISVALVTRNRPISLERTLKSLRCQSEQPFEVVISDDSSEEYASNVEKLAYEYGCGYISGPRRGLYANRNHSALACRGTHIRTMDDDHEFPPDHFAQCISAVKEDANSVWIIGETHPDKPIVESVDCPGQLHPRGFSFLPPNPQNCWAIADGASIYPQTLFRNGLRFVDDFKFGASYLEFGSRLYALGYRIRLLSSTYILHHFDLNTRSFIDLEMDMGSRFFAALCHANLYQPCLRNVALCYAEFGKQLIQHRGIAWRAWQSGYLSYRRQSVRVTKDLQNVKYRAAL